MTTNSDTSKSAISEHVPTWARLQYAAIRDQVPNSVGLLLTHPEAVRLWKTLAKKQLATNCPAFPWPAALVNAVAEALEVPNHEKVGRSELKATLAEAANHASRLRVTLLELEEMGVDPGVFQLPGMHGGELVFEGFARAVGKGAAWSASTSIDAVGAAVHHAAARYSVPGGPTVLEVVEQLLLYFEQAMEAAESGLKRHAGSYEKRWMFHRLRSFFFAYFGEEMDYSAAKIATILLGHPFHVKDVCSAIDNYTPPGAQVVAELSEKTAVDSGFEGRAMAAFHEGAAVSAVLKGGIAIIKAKFVENQE